MKTPEQIAREAVRQYITAPFARNQMDPRELIAGLGLSNAQAASIFDMVIDAIEADRAQREHLTSELQEWASTVSMFMAEDKSNDWSEEIAQLEEIERRLEVGK